MKFSAAILLGATAAMAQMVTVADVPGCALQCFITNVPDTGCGLTDVNCQCQPMTRSKLTAAITPCVIGACTPENALKVQSVTNQLCVQAGFPSMGGSGSSSSSSAAATSSSSSAAASSSSSSAAASSSSSMAAAPASATPASSTPATGGAGSSPVASAQPSTYTGAANKAVGSFGAVAAGVVAAFAL